MQYCFMKVLESQLIDTLRPSILKITKYNFEYKMKVVPIRLDDRILKDLDLLVKAGVYKNRSDALRKIIESGMRKVETEIDYLRKIDAIIDRLIDSELDFGGTLRRSLEEDRNNGSVHRHECNKTAAIDKGNPRSREARKFLLREKEKLHSYWRRSPRLYRETPIDCLYSM